MKSSIQGERRVDEHAGQIAYLNEMIAQTTGLKDTFAIKSSAQFGFRNFHDKAIFNQHEGQIHPGKMMQQLYAVAAQRGVRFLMGHKISDIKSQDSAVTIVSDQFTLLAEKVIVCTNGFTQKLLPDLKISPARNQVLVTKEIAGLNWKSCFHFDRGYVYFRNVGQRLLIGGGRNIAKENETTSEFEITQQIEAHLEEFLEFK